MCLCIFVLCISCSVYLLSCLSIVLSIYYVAYLCIKYFLVRVFILLLVYWHEYLFPWIFITLYINCLVYYQCIHCPVHLLPWVFCCPVHLLLLHFLSRVFIVLCLLPCLFIDLSIYCAEQLLPCVFQHLQYYCPGLQYLMKRNKAFVWNKYFSYVYHSWIM